MSYTLQDLTKYLATVGMAATVDGDASKTVDAVATLEDAQANEISFLANPKYEAALQTTNAGAVIVGLDQARPDHLSVLRTRDPYAAMTAIVVRIHGYRQHQQVGISESAQIHADARIGANVNIHHGVTIEANVEVGNDVILYPGVYLFKGCRIGAGSVLYPNVVVYPDCILGQRVTLHAGTVIGEDGLGYAMVEGKWHKIPQIGITELGDDVELGANCAIDRATLGQTHIGAGTKFSNLVTIGHGTKIGKHCMFVAQVGLAGSVQVGDYVTMAGKVGVAGHLKIGDRAKLSAMSGVMRDIPDDGRVFGIPALPYRQSLRATSAYEKLPETTKQVKQLEAKVSELTQQVAALMKKNAGDG